MEPSEAPAPTTVWSSSMKRMTSPSDSWTSLRTALRRSSNSPRYLAPAMRAPEVEGHHALVLEGLGDVAVDDAPGEALDDGGLAHAGLADEDRVVLGAAGEDLDDAADLVVAADDGVELALAGLLGEVAAVALEGLEAVLGVGVVDGLVPADLLQDLEEPVAGDAGALEGLGGRGLRLEQRQEQVLGGDVLVLEGLGLAHGLLQGRVELGRDVGGRALRLGEGGELLVDLGGDAAGVRAQLAERGRHHSSLLREQGS